MTGRPVRRFCMKEVATVGLLVLLAGIPAVPDGHAGDIPEADEKHHRTVMALAIRIAQAEGNEGKVRKYKSLARQQRARKQARPDSSPR